MYAICTKPDGCPYQEIRLFGEEQYRMCSDGAMMIGCDYIEYSDE